MATPSTTVEVDGREVRVTNPAKPYFPEAPGGPIRKLDLVTYWIEVAPAALAGCRDRPTTLHRFPDGASGEGFYQKRLPKGAPAWVETALITFPSGRTADMPVMADAAHLAWVATLGCLEINPWPVRADDVDRPDELRIDLDPMPEVPFDQVREVALVARAVLEEHGLVGFPKTSGKRGIHVNARIEARWAFTEVRRAALALAREVERRAPELCTTAWWKEERHGVFLDYNQNAKDRTVASAYSVRPTPDARVSFPLRWDEVPHAVMEDFTLTTVPSIYRDRGDAGAGSDEAVGSLETLLELSARHEAEGEGDAPWPPNYAKQEGEPPRVQPSRKRRTDAEYEGRGVDGGPPPEVAAARAAAVAAGDRNAGLPTEWQGSVPSPTGRRKSSVPVVEIGRAPTKQEVYAGLERWKARHPEAASHLEPADILETAMRGRAYAWYRLRVRLTNVPETLRPPQEELDPDAAPDDWGSLSDDEREAWLAGRKPTRRKAAAGPGDAEPSDPS
ncbi:MAG TPA: DNA polymerase domain-containing protein, partial [Actinomycetota bacterium]|nr:DNA polymerase domain-containing protein [Actinomycetota bacterium]